MAVITFVPYEIHWNMKLFVIEGVDGAGKSTQLRLLMEFFSSKGFKCEYLISHELTLRISVN